MKEWRYPASLAVRVYLTLFSYAYIHPDEYFQGAEPLYGDLYGIPTLRTWEFDPTKPCRSMASIRLANLPSVLHSFATFTPSPLTLFRLQRLTFLLWSFLLDLVVYKLSPRALLPLSLSSSMLAFQIRPFSNSVESVALALSLLFSQRRRSPFLLGAVAAIGFFSRFTFAIFFLPIGLLLLLRRRGIFAAALGFVVVAAAHVWYDSRYYGIGWVATPLNAFLYNVRSENVAAHGTHPRWLHALVNLPLMVGVATIASWRKARWTPLAKLSAAIVVTGVLGLSISPHQEPRFLLPLAVPAALIAPLHGYWLWLHILQHTLQTIVFGLTHQAGLVPAMLSLDDSVKGVAFCRAFMPPRHLLPPHIAIYDAGPDCTSYGSATHLLAPTWAASSLSLPVHASFGPHLDTDHLAEIWQSDFSFNVYTIPK